MILSINQPAYLPWLGYFHRIAVSDVHVILDNVQFEKNSFTNRNKIRRKDGWTWLTIPVKTKGKFGELPICELEIANETPWAKKHWDGIRFSYAKTPFFKEYESFLSDVYSRSWSHLKDIMETMNARFLKMLGIQTKILKASDLKPEGKKDDLILNLCVSLGAKVYISGPLGRNYLHEEKFMERGIRIVYHDYRHPVYPTLHQVFEPNMAVIDLLFNVGSESFHILSANQERIAEQL